MAPDALRAIVLAAGEPDALRPLADRRPSCLFPLLGKAIAEHVVEALVARGVRELHVVVDHFPDLCEKALGDGTRWGAKIEYHLVPGAEAAWKRVATIARRFGEASVVLARADVLPALPADSAFDPASSAAWFGGPKRTWSGWCHVSASVLASLPKPCHGEVVALEHLRARSNWIEVRAMEVLDHRTWQGVLAAQRATFDRRVPGLMLAGREVEPGVHLSRNVALHPSAQIQSPVYIGENVRIDAGARIGPHAAVGSGCIVAESAVVEDAAVWSDTYVGEAVEVRNAIADRGTLVKVDLGVAVPRMESFLLGDLLDRTLERVTRDAVERVAGSIGFVLATPLIAACALALAVSRSQPVIDAREVVRLPLAADARRRTVRVHTFGCSSKPRSQRSWLERWMLRSGLDRLPGLFDVARGVLHLAGVEPRDASELEQLDPEWRAICSSGRMGLATLVEVRSGSQATREDRYAAEAYHMSVPRSLTRDTWIFLRWIVAPKSDREPVAAARPTPSELLERFQGDRRFLAESIERFMSSCDGELAELASALEGGDLERAAKLAHRLRGSVSLFSCAAACEAAEALELAARRRSSESAIAALAEVRREMALAKSELAELSQRVAA